MFITGPGRGAGGHRRADQPRRAGRRRRARRRLRAWRTFVYDDEEELPGGRAVPAVAAAVEQPGAAAARARRPTRPDRRTDGAARPGAGRPSQPYDMRAVIEEIVDDGEFFEVHAALGDATSSAPWPGIDGHAVGIVANQPAVARRRARHPRQREGRAVRPDLRRVQHPAGHPGRRARLPARRGPGARRHHPARRQAALRVLQRHRAPRSSSSCARRTAAPTS